MSKTPNALKKLAHASVLLWLLEQEGLLTCGTDRILISRKASLVRISAPGHLGYLPAKQGVEELCALGEADELPAACVLISRGFHGRLAHLVRPLAERGYPAIAMQATTPKVHTEWSDEAALGTNPIAIAAPGGEEPIVADLTTATSSYASSALESAFQASSPPPDLMPFGGIRGWALTTGIQAFLRAVAGTDLLQSTEWPLIILAFPRSEDADDPSLDLETWRRRMGVTWLPGQRSRFAFRKAMTSGLVVPACLWRWLID